MSESEIPGALAREFVIAGHGNLPRVKEMLLQNPELLNVAYPWSESDRETAIQGAAQVGNAPIAEFLLSSGAPLDICTAAMLGRVEAVEGFLRNDPQLIRAKGAHGIPVLPHAALSGRPELVSMLVKRGATEGMAFALHNAASRSHYDVAQWLLDNVSPDLTWKDYRGKTALETASERNDTRMEELLRKYNKA